MLNGRLPVHFGQALLLVRMWLTDADGSSARTSLLTVAFVDRSTAHSIQPELRCEGREWLRPTKTGSSI